MKTDWVEVFLVLLIVIGVGFVAYVIAGGQVPPS